MQNQKIEFKILGGNGEFGRNCIALRQDNLGFIVDCGMAFPKNNAWNLERIVTDVSSVFSDDVSFKGYFITHAHEDHIGGLLYALEQKPAPVYASSYTLEIIKSKIKELNHKLLTKVDFITLKSNEYLKIEEDFEILPLEVEHSIPQSFALLFKLKVGKVLFTGDYRFSSNSENFPHLDLWKKEVSKQVFLMFGDSSGILTEGDSPEESDVAISLKNYFKNIKGRIFITQFSSNIKRIQTIAKAASENHRKVALFGKSMLFYSDVAKSLGIGFENNSNFVPMDQINKYERNEQVIIISGSQGENFSSLNRLSFNHIKNFTLQKDDAVFFSSRTIPGREQQIISMIDRIIEAGATVMDEIISDDLHSSGHSYSNGIKRMLNLVSPEVYVPVHGNYRNINTAGKLAKEMEINEVLILKNGNSAKFEDEIWEIDEFKPQVVFLDGEKHQQISKKHLKQRFEMADRGVVFVYLVTDAYFTPLTLPMVEFLGIGTETSTIKYKKLIINGTLKLLPSDELCDIETVKEKIRLEILRIFRKNYGKKPIVKVILQKLDF